MKVFSDFLWVIRYHIVLIAMAAALVFGWLFSGQYLLLLTVWVGVDWFAINLVNRITDLPEDQRNNVPGTAMIARHPKSFTAATILLWILSLSASHQVHPEITGYRLLTQTIGVLYNIRLIPSLTLKPYFKGPLTRFKEMYFFKNVMSVVIFVLTSFAYPLAVTEDAHGANHLAINALPFLLIFFVTYELTFEIIYDLRDIEGDRAEGIPTYPVIHGARTSLTIVKGLLMVNIAALLIGFFLRVLGVRELLMLVAPIVQAVWIARHKDPWTSKECLWLTHVGTIELVLFVLGTALWRLLSLPGNIYLG